MPGTRYSQHYHFSVVIHNVNDPGLKDKLSSKVNLLQPDWSLLADEPYNDDSPGSHIHVFLKYNKKKSWMKVLQFFQKHSDGHTHTGKRLLRSGKEGTLGHVKCSPGKGDFNECKKYITDPDKSKKLDENITENIRKLALHERYPEHCRRCPDCNKNYFDPPMELMGELLILGYCWKCSMSRLRRTSTYKLPDPPEQA